MTQSNYRKLFRKEIAKISVSGLSAGNIFLEPHQLRGYDAIKEALSTTS